MARCLTGAHGTGGGVLGKKYPRATGGAQTSAALKAFRGLREGRVAESVGFIQRKESLVLSWPSILAVSTNGGRHGHHDPSHHHCCTGFVIRWRLVRQGALVLKGSPHLSRSRLAARKRKPGARPGLRILFRRPVLPGLRTIPVVNFLFCLVLRTKWVGIRTDEIFLRDTAHGFLSWALATALMAVFSRG